MQNFKSKIMKAKSSFELSCICEEVRDAYWNRKSISREMYDKRLAEIATKRGMMK
jgi:hypothetical protein